MARPRLSHAWTMLVTFLSALVGHTAHAQSPCCAGQGCPTNYSCLTFTWIEVCDSTMLPPNGCDSPTCADTCRFADDVCTPEILVPAYNSGGYPLCARLDGVKFCALERTIADRLCVPNEVSGGPYCSCDVIIGQTWCPLMETYQWYAFAACL
jgi:hypothetical protein